MLLNVLRKLLFVESLDMSAVSSWVLRNKPKCSNSQSPSLSLSLSLSLSVCVSFLQLKAHLRESAKENERGVEKEKEKERESERGWESEVHFVQTPDGPLFGEKKNRTIFAKRIWKDNFEAVRSKTLNREQQTNKTFGFVSFFSRRHRRHLSWQLCSKKR